MLKRYVEIRDAIKMVQAAEDLVPRTSSHRRIVQLLSKLGDLDSQKIKLFIIVDRYIAMINMCFCEAQYNFLFYCKSTAYK
ncbi:hypothetical protein F443_23024, partial [Phytophthora nicotianae P1569]